MKRVVAGAVALAIAATLVITFINYEDTETEASPQRSTMGYSQGKYDPIKPLRGTTNVPINPFNKGVPSAQPQRDGGGGTAGMDDEWDE